MKSVNIWFVSDNPEGDLIAKTMMNVDPDVHVHLCVPNEFSSESIDERATNMAVMDIFSNSLESILSFLAAHPRLNTYLKYVLVDPSVIHQALRTLDRIMHLEVIEKPVDPREFCLLLEKSMLVERYRELVDRLSSEYEKRIASYESLLQINRDSALEGADQIRTFEKIAKFEKELLAEQRQLVSAIHDFSSFRRRDVAEMRKFLDAGRILDELRERELIEATKVIKAQEKVLELSHREIDDYLRAMRAQEITVELSREEAIALHEKIAKLEKENEELLKKIASSEKK